MKTDTRVAAKGATFAEKIAKQLVKREYPEPEDLMGVVLADERFDSLVRIYFSLVTLVWLTVRICFLCQNPAEVGVIHRAQQRIEGQQQPPQKSDFEKLTKLLEDKEEQKQKEKEKEAAPKVDIGTSIKNTSLRDITADLWPRASAVEFIAVEMAKLVKKKVTQRTNGQNKHTRHE